MCCVTGQIQTHVYGYISGDNSHCLKPCIIRERRILGYLDTIELYSNYSKIVEKITEIADLSFHLLQPLFLRLLNTPTFDCLNELHHGAHHLEHVLHSFCFLGDVVAIARGKFTKDAHGHQLTKLQMTARVTHSLSHFLATTSFLRSLHLCHIKVLSPLENYPVHISAISFLLASCLSVRGYLLAGSHHKFGHLSDFRVNLSGFVSNALQNTSHTPLKVIGQIAGIIHSIYFIAEFHPVREKFDIKLN